jgi:enoyl-CoA hydratase
MGLVNRVVEAAALETAAGELIEGICANAPVAVALAKDAVDRGAELTTAEAVRHAERNLARLLETNDLREGITAFLERRPPRFVGR